MRCDICGGSEIVRLPIRREAMAAAVGDGPVSVEESSRTYPCPECCNKVPHSKVATFYVEKTAPAEYLAHTDYLPHFIRSAAHGFVDALLTKGVIQTKTIVDDDPAGFGRRSIRLRARLGVVSAADVATIEQRALDAGSKVALEAAAAACAGINNCGSHFNRHVIHKHDATRLLNEAVSRVLRDKREAFAK